MAQANAGSGFRIVARGFLGRHLHARGPASADGQGRQGRPVRHRDGARARRAHPAHDRRLRPRSAAPSRSSSRPSARPRARCSNLPGRATRLYAMVGPMGIPSHIGKAKKVVCVGGGLGVAPMYPQARACKESGAYVIGVIGFRNKDLMFWEDKFGARVRRADRLHRRRLRRHQGPRHRGHQAGDRRSTRTSTKSSPSARRS